MFELDCDSIGIISDTHGDVNAWQKAVSLFAKCGAIFHAGDVLSHSYSTAFVPDALVQEINCCGMELFFAMGNCDNFGDAQLLLPVLSPLVTVNWRGKIICMAHGDNPSWLRAQATNARANLVISGHTHIAHISKQGSAIYVNPGSASRPRGQDPATVAIADKKGISILTLDGKCLVNETWN